MIFFYFLCDLCGCLFIIFVARCVCVLRGGLLTVFVCWFVVNGICAGGFIHKIDIWM